MLVTYLDKTIVYRFADIDDKELSELLSEANSANDHFVIEPIQKKRWLRKPEMRYYLYGRLSEGGFQCINIGNTLEAVKAYLYGHLNGIKRK